MISPLSMSLCQTDLIDLCRGIQISNNLFVRQVTMGQISYLRFFRLSTLHRTNIVGIHIYTFL